MKSVLAAIAGIVLAMSAADCDRDCPLTTALPASPDHLPPGVNAVQNEMRLLHEAMRDTVSAIALGTLSSIPERLAPSAWTPCTVHASSPSTPSRAARTSCPETPIS